jgi:hypothetical protein
MSDPLDPMIEAGCALLGITPEPSWLPTIRQNLEVSLRLARLVEEFPLPDEAEPAPVFRA